MALIAGQEFPFYGLVSRFRCHPQKDLIQRPSEKSQPHSKGYQRFFLCIYSECLADLKLPQQKNGSLGVLIDRGVYHAYLIVMLIRRAFVPKSFRAFKVEVSNDEGTSLKMSFRNKLSKYSLRRQRFASSHPKLLKSL